MLNGRTILVADDELSLCNVIGQAFRLVGARVFMAQDGREAVRLMERRPIDLAVIDIIMPHQEGVETIIEIRRRWPECRIIAISGGGRIDAETFLALARDFGADATLRKPLKTQELLATSLGVLRRAA